MVAMDRNLIRLLDANFNRAREALRVMEDCARFVLDDPALSNTAKQARHDLCTAMRVYADADLLACRDTPGDVGTGLTGSNESVRADMNNVILAAGRRLSEALRCLEEYSKLDQPACAAAIEAVRYRGYDLEKCLIEVLTGTARFAKVRLYVLLTAALCRRSLLDTARAAIDGGADCLQLREKDMTAQTLLKTAAELSDLCKRNDVLLFINDRTDIAATAGADGVHLGLDDLSVTQARRLAPTLMTGSTAHSTDEAREAKNQRPTYIALGSIFGSPTKPDVPRTGTDLIRDVRAFYDGPLVAIGGVTETNAAAAIAAGATSVAVCDAVIATENPDRAAAAIRKRLDA